METVFYFIRHGESEANAQKKFQGWSIDSALTEKGMQESKEIKEKMKNKKISAVYSSPAKRCTQTAEIIFENGCIIDDRLKERGLGEWEGKTKYYVKEKWPEEYAQYKLNRDTRKVKGSEQFEELEARGKQFLHEIIAKHDGQKVAVISHGGWIKAMIMEIMGLPREELTEMKIPNLSVYEVIFSGKGIGTGRINEGLQ